MDEGASDLLWLGHPSLTAAAFSAFPAWLWSFDATRLLWANPVGAAIFDAPLSAAIRASVFGSRGPAAIQVARLAATLRVDGETRSARLRGLGTGVGGVLACSCSSIRLADNSRAVLVAATERAGADWPLAERLRRLLGQCAAPVAAFSAAGELIQASAPAKLRLGGAPTLMAIGAEGVGAMARQSGRARGMSTIGPLCVERIDVEAATILLAVLEALATPAPRATNEVMQPVERAARRRPPWRFVWHMDADQHFTIDSEEFLHLAGARTAALLGRPWAELAAALDLDPRGQIARALASRETWSGLSVAWPVENGGKPLTVELSGLPVYDRERVFGGYRGFGICRADAHEAAPTIEGLSKVVPLRQTQPAPPSLNAVERNAFHELTRRLQERLEAAGATAASPDAEVAAAPISHDDPPPSDLSVATDADDQNSALSRAQAEILKLRGLIDAARREAEKAASAKFDLLARISHEIRSPLNAIIGFSEIIAEERFGPLPNERYRQYLGDIKSSGAHLMSLVNDLLDLSKLEAGKLDLSLADVALNPMIQECVAVLQPQANRERIILRTSLSLRLPQVRADARSLQQIVLNLISHASSLAGSGGQVIVATGMTDVGEVVLRVRDNGPGMSESEIAIALQPFRRASATARPSGTGSALALPLVKALTEANQARLHIKSTAEPGTLIEVVFPRERVLTA
ncbi:MAG TPA: HAMP domain-containing sensor histidine kinase [Xanthobacteraceae bacterium]|nr:HAMP domain-containing sensor histidine kinase [Xanthobacteraceae bacterium]